MHPAVGTRAPGFTLKDQDNVEVALSQLQGGSVLLVFYPFAFSRICTGELRELRESHATYLAAGVTVLGISTDPTYALKAYAKQEALRFGLLSDFWPHGAVATTYGVFDERAGMAVRGTFLIDRAGVLTFAEVNERGQPRDQSAWQRAVQALGTLT